MGVISEMIHESLIPEAPDRNSNRLRIHRDPNGEVTINYRNLKIVLHTPEEVAEWREGFKIALDNLGDWFKDDIA